MTSFAIKQESPVKKKDGTVAISTSVLTSRHPRVKQISKSRLDFEIAPNMRIGVWVYIKTKIVDMPTLKKVESGSNAPVRLDRSYARIDNPDISVPDSERLMALRYGGEYVPLMKEDKDSIKYETGKVLKLIGFFPENQFPIYKGLGNADCIAAEPGNVQSAIALSSLIHAMIESKRVALARFGARENSEPKLVALFPVVTEEYECFYSVQMPFSEDSRESSLIFPSLPVPDSILTAAIDDYIDAKILEPNQLRSEDIPNPSLDRFWRTVEARANGNGDEPVAEIDQQIWKHLNPEFDEKYFEKISKKISEISGLNEYLPEDDPEVKKRKRYWREIHDRELVPEPSGLIDVKKIKIESTQETDFENGNKYFRNIYNAISENHISEAVDLVAQFHTHTLESNASKTYNDFMRKLGESANPRIWREILRRDIPMQISVEESPDSSLSRDDALEFISFMIKKI